MKKVEEKLKYLYTMTANYPNQSPRLILEGKNVIMSNKFTLISLDRKLEGRKWGGARDSVQHKRETEAQEKKWGMAQGPYGEQKGNCNLRVWSPMRITGFFYILVKMQHMMEKLYV